MSDVAEHRRARPSPLAFHLGAAAAAYQSAIAGAAAAGRKDFPWHPSLAPEAAELPEALDTLALCAAANARLGRFLSGLRKWQTHPYRRNIEEPPVIWQEGAARLLDYGQAPEACDPKGPVVLVVPSLINRAYILDLDEDNSLLRYLASRGLRPLLLDWGEPGDSERGFDFGDYATQRILPALEIATKSGGAPPAVLGYCMGGTLAAGTLSVARADVRTFASIGSPWDFSGYKGVAATLRGLAGNDPSLTEKSLLSQGETFGLIPAELFQILFAILDPLQAAVKFRKFDTMDMDSAEARCFVALEDWLAESVPMATSAAKNLLIDWNMNNATARGDWVLNSERVGLARLQVPALAICGLNDTIAPPEVARPLAAAIPGCRLLTPAAGHVGMIAGRQAPKSVWEPLAEFLLQPDR